MAPRQTLAGTTAEQLRRDLETYTGDRLPTVRDLAKRYDVSYVTMVRACAILKEEGLLSGRRGASIRKTFGRGAAAPRSKLRPMPKSLDIVRDRVASDIAAGRLKAGEKLPKVYFFVKEFSVSNHTVLKAYRELEDQGLIRRLGKSWVVGSSEAARPFPFGEDPPVILFLEPWHLFWQRDIHNPRTAGFSSTFMAEADRWGVQVVSLSAATRLVEESLAPAGWRHAVGAYIHGLGNRYLGALIPFGSRDRENPVEWAREMLAYGKPVVWFDRHNELRIEGLSARLFTRCHFDENPAIEAAIGHLYENGHREVGYLYRDPDSSWRTKRLFDLQAAADARRGMHIHGFTQPQGFYDGLFEPDFPDFLSRLRSRSPHNVDQVLQTLASLHPKCAAWSQLPKKPSRPDEPRHFEAWKRYLDHLPRRAPEPPKTPRFIRLATDVLRSIRFTSIYYKFANLTSSLHLAAVMIKALSRTDITAWILPNDLEARLAYRWVEDAGIRVPEQLSLLSFDNSTSLSGFPISSVDFGFGRLGYSAFHLLLQDIPVKRSRHGEVAGQPFIVNRGSVKRRGH
jgi:DNA-binding transcriptional regulator YhcF (GntR family)/DNA-binding LacI/PurR family transcriptional regulator